jgi:hypothetical protein
MALYRTTFYRMNFGVTPALKQTAEVLFRTDIPYENGQLAKFDKVRWAAMLEQNPHWADAKGPSCLPTGWSGVLGGDDTEKVDEGILLSLAWHITQQGWLQADGASITLDVDEAGQFTPDEILALQQRYPGEDYPMVQPKQVTDVYGANGYKMTLVKLQLRLDTYVLWGYGKRGFGPERVVPAETRITDDLTFKFDLPEATEGREAPQEYERRRSWAWRFLWQGGNLWNLAESQESALEAAKAEAVKQMRSSSYRHCTAVLAVKHNVEITAAN